MKALRVTMHVCQRLASLKPRAYIGYRIVDENTIKHLVLVGRRRLAKVRVDCSECVLGKLMKTSTLLSMPVLEGELVRFIVLDTPALHRMLQNHGGRVVGVEPISISNIVLTEKQRKILQPAASASPTPSRIAAALGVTRQAAQRLLRQVVRKLSTVYA